MATKSCTTYQMTNTNFTLSTIEKDEKDHPN